MYCDSFSCQRLTKCCCKICKRLPPASYKCLKNCCCKIWKGKPYYKTRYEELLSEETDKHLDEKLRQIAKKRAEGICSNHICDIENIEFRYNITTEISEKATEAWSNISRSNFYVEKLPKDMNHVYVSDDLLYFIWMPVWIQFSSRLSSPSRIN